MADNRYIGRGLDLSYLANQNQSAAATATPDSGQQAAGQTIDIPAAVFTVTEQSFQGVMQLSQVVPVILLFVNPADQATVALHDALATGVRGAGGKLTLGVIDATASPSLVQAFSVQTVPTAALVLAGQPELLFQGQQDPNAVVTVLPQIVSLAAAQGMTGTVNAPDLGETAPAETQNPVNPEHQKALDAAEAGDYKTAIAEYKNVLARNPRDNEASAALAQVELLERLSGKSAQEIREAAANSPHGLSEQMAVSDLDIAGGHIEDGFLRLLDLFENSTPDDRAHIQERLLKLFEVVGVIDPRVSAARRKLANLLY
ncbi:tetratricopeptide repeat protein [Canibacter zhoujuaniae]|uniref:tetratricopeptide repeat protein n=1 Tax=Canibacter zhoujuaniae TaxID=2708343 RepID=UPI00141E2C75|nr:tetratricopeptide repeat protein [Canibacter zhoujuaniae]